MQLREQGTGFSALRYAGAISLALLLSACADDEIFGDWSETQQISEGSGNRAPQVAMNSNIRMVVWEKVSYSTSVDNTPSATDPDSTHADPYPGDLDHTHYQTTASTGVWAAVQFGTAENETDWETPVKLAQGDSRKIKSYAVSNVTGAQVWGDQLAQTEFTDVSVGIDSSNRGQAVWAMQDSNGLPAIYAASFNGSSWSTPFVISNTTQAVRKPQIAMEPGGNAIAIWEQRNETCQCYTLVARLYKRSVNGWETSGGSPVITLISDDGTGTANGKPATVLNASVVYSGSGVGMVAWNQIDTNGTLTTLPTESYRYIYARPLLVSGWDTATAVSDTGTAALAENLSLNINTSGQAIVAWEQWDSITTPTGKRIYASIYSSGSWSTQANVHDDFPSLDADEVTAAIDENGRGHVAWAVHEGADNLGDKWNNTDSQLWLSSGSGASWAERRLEKAERLAIHQPELVMMNDPVLVLSWRQWQNPTTRSSYGVYSLAVNVDDDSLSGSAFLGNAANDESGSLDMAASGSSLVMTWSEDQNRIKSAEYSR